MTINRTVYTNIEFDPRNTFTPQQITVIKKLNIPTALLFKTASKFDDKYINTKKDKWTFTFSGQKSSVQFIGGKHEVLLKKYILACFVSKNSPIGLSHLNNILTSFFSFNIKSSSISYSKSMDFIKRTTNSKEFYFFLFFIKTLCRIDFPEFDIDNLEDLEFIPRPINNSWSNYQNIDAVLKDHDKNLISKGIHELSFRITSNSSDKVLIGELQDSAVLGLCYVCGIRPVQLARLAVGDINLDSKSKRSNLMRYSIAIPYAKQQKLILDKILIAIPPELARIMLEYELRTQRNKGDQLFNIGSNAIIFVNEAINRQMMRFAPLETRKAIESNNMVQPHYTSSDFRHNVGHSLAMTGASAEEVAHIMGHTSLVAAKHYILATPELALVREKSLGNNPVWQNMISMLLTGSIVSKSEWQGNQVSGIVHNTLYSELGGCNRSYDECPFSEVRSCYGCLYFNPFKEGNHNSVLQSVEREHLDLIELSDSVGNSKNPLIQVYEATSQEIKSVIARCESIAINPNAITLTNVE